MANIKNWQPELSLSEHEWFDKCPKSVLFEIARQFAMRCADRFTAEAAFQTMQDEWDALHANGIVPQKPFKARSDDDILAKMIPELRALHLAKRG
jgi:hypothetical protein